MEVHMWRSVFGILCIPAVSTGAWTAFQSPLAVTLTLNSSAEISCSTSLPDPNGLYLQGRFHGHRKVAYVSLDKGEISKTSRHPTFADRVDVTSDSKAKQGCHISFRLSHLGLVDTDLYYCSWIYVQPPNYQREMLQTNGTVVIVRERDPAEHCDGQIVDLVLIVLSANASILILLFAIGALIKKYTLVQRHYRPPGLRAARQQHVRQLTREDNYI